MSELSVKFHNCSINDRFQLLQDEYNKRFEENSETYVVLPDMNVYYLRFVIGTPKRFTNFQMSTSDRFDLDLMFDDEEQALDFCHMLNMARINRLGIEK